MNKSYLLVAYALIVVIICTGVGWKLGYSAKHAPVYIYVKYNNSVSKNLEKALVEADIPHTSEQVKNLGKILKAGEKHAR